MGVRAVAWAARLMILTFAQMLYSTLVLLCIWGAMGLQRYRHQHGPTLLYGAYTALIFFLGWELIDCVTYGAPGFPCQRWFLYGSLSLIFCIGTCREIRARRPSKAET
jgi:hypothetical protein